MRPISAVLTIRDGKGKDAQMLINIINQAEEADIAKQLEMARRFQVDIDGMTTGQIVRCGLILDVPLDSSLKTSAGANSDIEEGALFVFKSSTGFNTSTRVPTFDESKLVTGTPMVDLANPAITAFVTNMIDGYEASAGNRRDVQDNRGDDIIALLSAKQSFQRSRV